jgi:two-component system sensor histidine kinase CiaH
MPNKTKKIRRLFFIYWVLLSYIIAALVWWFISLTRQNDQMTAFEMRQLNSAQPQYAQQAGKIQEIQKRKTAQYIGEGDHGWCGICFEVDKKTIEI